MRRALLVLNTGSSSVKFALHDADTRSQIVHGAIEKIDRAPCLTLHAAGASQVVLPEGGFQADTAALIDWLLKVLIEKLGPITVTAAGHRVVHGGRNYSGPVIITDEVIAGLTALCKLAPGHQPYNLAGIRAVARNGADSLLRHSVSSGPPAPVDDICLAARPV
jgi:acetate kinase